MGKIEKATQWMIDLANNPKHGYDHTIDGDLTTTVLLQLSAHGRQQVCQ